MYVYIKFFISWKLHVFPSGVLSVSPKSIYTGVEISFLGQGERKKHVLSLPESQVKPLLW